MVLAFLEERRRQEAVKAAADGDGASPTPSPSPPPESFATRVACANAKNRVDT